MPIGLGQKQHDRRRRVLRDERVVEEAASEGARRRSRRRPPHRYGAGARRQRQPALLDLLPRRWPALVATFLAALSLISAMLLGVWGVTGSGPLANLPLWQTAQAGSILSRAVSWYGSVSMLGVSLVAFQIYLLRKHRRDDYQGHYAVWLWVAVFSLLTAADLGIGWGAWAIGALGGALGLPPWGVTLWMVAPTLGIAVRLGFEVRESRGSLILLALTTLGTICGLLSAQLLNDAVLVARLVATTVLVGSLGAGCLSLWHLRFVVAQVHDHGTTLLGDSAEELSEAAEPAVGPAKATRTAAANSPPSVSTTVRPSAPAASTSATTSAATAWISTAPTVAETKAAPEIKASPGPASLGLGDRIASVSQADDEGDEDGDEEGDDSSRRGGMSKAQRRKMAKQERRRQRDAA